jgi:hypothetical protein
MILSRIPQNFIDTYSRKVNELKMMEPLLSSDNTWFIDITITADPKYLSYIFHIFFELKNLDPSVVYIGSWTVILLTIDR